MTIIIASYKTFQKYIGSEIIDAVDLVLMDEIQKITCEDYSPVVTKTPYAYARIGWSATPFRDDNASMLVKGYCGPELYKKTTKELVDQGFLARPIIKTANLFSDAGLLWLIERARTNKVVLFHEHKLKGVEETRARFERILEHWPPEYKAIGQAFMEESSFIYSEDKSCFKAIEEFKGKRTGAIFTTPLMDVGVDIPDIDTVILMQVRGKKTGAVVQNIQRIGRGMRVPYGQQGKELLTVIQHDVSFEGQQPTRTCKLYKALTQYNVTKDEDGYYQEFDHGSPFLFAA